MSNFWVKYQKLDSPVKTSFFTSKDELINFINGNLSDYDFKIIDQGDTYAPKKYNNEKT